MIRSRAFLAAAAAALLSASCGERVDRKPYPDVDPARIAAHLERYTQAEAAGMEPGGRGEQLAVAYTKSVFTEMGLSVQTPAVPLTTIRTTHATVSLSGAGGTRTLQDDEDVVVWTRRHEAVTSAEGDVVFVGYGISSRRQGWDDYKDVDVRGKILLMLIGDPHVGRRRLLGAVGGDLYGRMPYKFAEAERRGAAGVLLVHLDDQSDEPWSALRHTRAAIVDAGKPGQSTPHMPVEGWMSLEAAQQMFEDASLDFTEALAKAEQTNFVPVSLPMKAAARVESEIGSIASTNVIATLPPLQTPSEYVLFTSQWNNLPVGTSTGNDLTDDDPKNQPPPGVSIMLEVARALSHVTSPHRGFVFLVVTAAPQGLLGLDSYLENPAFAPATTRAAIHVAQFDPHADDKRVAIIGVAYEALKGLVREQAAEQFRVTEGDQDLERLHFFRPGRTALTMRQIPSIFLSSGETLDSSAEPQAALDMSTGVLDARLLFNVGLRVATDVNWPKWEPSSTLLDYLPAAAEAEDRRRRPQGIR